MKIVWGLAALAFAASAIKMFGAAAGLWDADMGDVQSAVGAVLAIIAVDFLLAMEDYG